MATKEPKSKAEGEAVGFGLSRKSGRQDRCYTFLFHPDEEDE